PETGNKEGNVTAQAFFVLARSPKNHQRRRTQMNLLPLLLRLVVGLTFSAHGAQKLFGAFGGGGLDGTAQMFEKLGLRPGWLHARFAGTAEFAGGLLLALGLFTTPAAAALTAVMIAAVVTVHVRNGFFVTNGGFEYNLALVAAV